MDDYMDKQTAADLLDNLVGMVDDNQGNDYNTALKMGIEALKAYTQPVQRWIPCSEKMPSEEGQYLVTLKSYGYGSEYQVVDIASFENGEWFKWENYEWFQCCDVIAWMMPLPEPYKDGE